jgi:hypothetical protein
MLSPTGVRISLNRSLRNQYRQRWAGEARSPGLASLAAALDVEEFSVGNDIAAWTERGRVRAYGEPGGKTY